MSNFPHEWKPSTLGHGETECIHCFATNREIAVIGDLNHCPSREGKARGKPMIPQPTEDEQQVAQVMNTISVTIQDYAEHLTTQGVPKQLFLTSALIAIAAISKDLGMPTAILAMALSKARQALDDHGERAKPN